jgi:hypothetical protein
MARKTINIDDLRIKANDMLLHSADNMRGERRGMMTLLEHALHETGNYKGFYYLSREDMADSINGTTASFGIDRQKGENKFDGTDNSRVGYI